jgi:L-lysine exporter family protein LysE/ArgO
MDLGLVNVAILNITIQRGGSAGFALGLGSSFGDMIYFTLALAGVVTIMTWPPVRWTLWLGGTSVLLFLTFRMVRAALRPHDLKLTGIGPDGDDPMGWFRLLVWGIALALSSPTAILWFAAVGGTVIASFGSDRIQLIPFTLGFFVASVLWSGILAYGIGYSRRLAGRQLVRILSLLSAVLFLYFAVFTFIQGLREMLVPAGSNF